MLAEKCFILSISFIGLINSLHVERFFVSEYLNGQTRKLVQIAQLSPIYMYIEKCHVNNKLNFEVKTY